MKNDLIHHMTESFEGHAQESENGVEYWLARDLQHLLGYTKWDNFLNVISKAKTACELSLNIAFPTILPASGRWSSWALVAQREINDTLVPTLQRGNAYGV